MDKYKTDGHKLLYHVSRVNNWLGNKQVYPIYMEISPVKICNHRCIFCAYDYLRNKNQRIKTSVLLSFIDEIAACGVKSLLYAGEGEPLLHPDIGKFIVRSKNKGIDVGLFTNGQLLNKELAEIILPALTFIRFSFNGGIRENYALIHNVKPHIFDKVIDNIKTAVAIKKKNKLETDIGLQFVLLPENVDYLIEAIKALKDTGIDYFTVKPFVQQSESQFYHVNNHISSEKINQVFEQAKSFSDKDFKVIVRERSFEEYGKRRYKRCYGTTFISVLNSAGDIATCLPYWDNEKFVFGNINVDSFRNIWENDKRKKIVDYLECKLDTKLCPPNCRVNSINEYLSNIKNRDVKHINFI